MKEEKTEMKGALGSIYVVQRVITVFVIIMAFFPIANPAKICGLVSDKISLFTAAISYSTLTEACKRPFRMGWVDEMTFVVLYIGAIVAVLGIAVTAAGACMSALSLIHI